MSIQSISPQYLAKVSHSNQQSKKTSAMNNFTTIPVPGKSIIDETTGEITPLTRTISTIEPPFAMVFQPFFHNALLSLKRLASINLFNKLLPLAYPDRNLSGQRIDFDNLHDLPQSITSNISKYKNELTGAGLIIRTHRNYYILNPLAVYSAYQQSDALQSRRQLIHKLVTDNLLHPSDFSSRFLKLYLPALDQLQKLNLKQQQFFHTLALHSFTASYCDSNLTCQVLKPAFDINLDRSLEKHNLFKQRKQLLHDMFRFNLLTTIHDQSAAFNPDVLYHGTRAQLTQHLHFQRNYPSLQSIKNSINEINNNQPSSTTTNNNTHQPSPITKNNCFFFISTTPSKPRLHSDFIQT